MTEDAFLWDRVEWRQGDGRYVFEVAQGGLLATLASPHGQRMTLPMVAWEGLLDAIAAARKAKVRAERSTPSRAGARWTQTETDELAAAFKAGAGVPALARAHNRTAFAIEAQLATLGLWDRLDQRPVAGGVRARRPDIPPDWPPDPPAQGTAERQARPVGNAGQARLNSG